MTKELLSVVIELDVLWIVDNTEINEVTFVYQENNGKQFDGEINIYELSHKCKEWAYEKSYMLESAIVETNKGKARCEVWSNCGAPRNTDWLTSGFYEDTEPEAIFKACEWIKAQK